MKEFGKIMLIIGTVIGSGFASGKEISVFFSRFGIFSYLFIFFSAIMFFTLFYFILRNGERGIKNFSSLKIFSVISVIVSVVFASSMFAGTLTILRSENNFLNILSAFLLLLIAYLVSKKEVKALAKINTFLIPLAVVALVVCALANIQQQRVVINNQSFFTEGLFSFLYVIMNVSTSSVIIGNLGKNLTKKQSFVTSLFSATILFLLLILINLVLLENGQYLNAQMPLLEMSNGAYKTMIKVVIFIGCLTTLLSLVFTISDSLKRLKISGFISGVISVVIPFCASFFGFGKIVSLLYPVVSVLGIILLFPFFQKKDKGN